MIYAAMTHAIVRDRLRIGGQACRFEPTPNLGGRIEPHLIVLHDTAGHLTPGSSVAWLTNPKSRVSAHAVVERDGSITQLADFDRVTWHAGESSWRGRRNVNAFSIGIEIVNPGRLVRRDDRCYAWFGASWPVSECVEIDSAAHGGRGWWLPYTPAQIEAIERLSRALVIAYPSIAAIAGHFEISPGRKVDPGPHFPLARLQAIPDASAAPRPHNVQIAQERLRDLGYFPGALDGMMGPRTRAALRTFQEQNGLPVTGRLETATEIALGDTSAKPMPAAAREETTIEDLRADGSATMTGASVVKRAAEAGIAVEVVKTATVPPAVPVPSADPITTASDLAARGEELRGLAERLVTLADWALTPGGLTTLATLGVLLAAWTAASRIEWARLTDHILGANQGR